MTSLSTGRRPGRDELLAVGDDALRWVDQRGSRTADGWEVAAADEGEPGGGPIDHIYSGTAGVLIALAQARLAGVDSFEDLSASAVARLGHVVDAAQHSIGEPLDAATEDLGLYTGLAGIAVALRLWASTTDDHAASRAADAALTALSTRIVDGDPATCWRDIIAGDAGILVTLVSSVAAGSANPHAKQAISKITVRLIAEAVEQPGGLDWYCCDDIDFLMPNFSHGGAGIGLALATAHAATSADGALAAATAAATRLIDLGLREDGTFAAPARMPWKGPDPSIAYGWCHGPTGTVRLFDLLASIEPQQQWQRYAAAGRRAVRGSGLPARLAPGFWDNIGACCGTVSVGNMALDAFSATADEEWLQWADELADDVLARRISDALGTRWSHTEHRADPPELPPTAGYMQGAAGIAAFLLRLHHMHQAGPSAPALLWPDNPAGYEPSVPLRR